MVRPLPSQGLFFVLAYVTVIAISPPYVKSHIWYCFLQVAVLVIELCSSRVDWANLFRLCTLSRKWLGTLQQRLSTAYLKSPLFSKTQSCVLMDKIPCKKTWWEAVSNRSPLRSASELARPGSIMILLLCNLKNGVEPVLRIWIEWKSLNTNDNFLHTYLSTKCSSFFTFIFLTFFQKNYFNFKLFSISLCKAKKYINQCVCLSF